jgi:hypothetical protein
MQLFNAAGFTRVLGGIVAMTNRLRIIAPVLFRERYVPVDSRCARRTPNTQGWDRKHAME